MDGFSTSQTLELLAQSAQQLAKALGPKPKFEHLAGTYPHSIQGDIQVALEKLASHDSSPSNDDPEDSREYRKSSLFTGDDLLELKKLFDVSSETTSSVRHDSMDEESLSEIRQRRLEDLRLAMEIVKAFNQPTESVDRIDKDDEKLMLMLAKSIYTRSIDSLGDLNAQQQDTLHSLIGIVKDSQLNSHNNNLILSVPATSPSPPPRSPSTSYLLPNNNPPSPSLNPGSILVPPLRTPSVSVIPATTYRLPLTHTAVHSITPQQNPSVGYLPPAADPAPSLPSPPSPTVFLVPLSPVQDNPLPPAPPPPITTTTTTQRPSTAQPPINIYLPPSKPDFQIPSLPLPLELDDDDGDSYEWLPARNPSNLGVHSNSPSDATLSGSTNAYKNASNGNVNYYHYHYHITGTKDDLFNQNKN